MNQEFTFLVSPPVDNTQMNRLFSNAWPHHTWTDFGYLPKRSLGFICCYHGDQLVGFVNLAWDGNRHAFLLDTTVDVRFQRRGLGRELVASVLRVAKENGVEWVHVDYEPELEKFYRECGFEPTLAGLVNVSR